MDHPLLVFPLRAARDLDGSRWRAAKPVFVLRVAQRRLELVDAERVSEGDGGEGGGGGG